MEKIKNFLTKLEKIPSYVYSIAIVASCFYSMLAVQIVGGASLIETYNEVLAGFGGSAAGFEITPSFIWISAVFSAFIGWGVFEIGVYAVPYIMRGRGYLQSDLSKFKFAARIGYIAINLIIGSYSFIAFLRTSVYNWTIDSVSLLSYLGIYTFLLILYRKEIFNGKHIFDAYKFLFSVYFIFEGVVGGINFVQIARARDQYMVGDLIFSAVHLGLVAVSAVVLGILLFKKFKKEQDENRSKIDISVLGSLEREKQDNDIFKDYGI